jgi:hypothetical protein
MVVVSGEIGGQSLNAGGDFQKAISETVGLRFGNGRVTAAAGNPFGNLTIVRRFGRRSERFHDRRVTLCRTRSNLSPLRRPTDALREEFPEVRVFVTTVAKDGAAARFFLRARQGQPFVAGLQRRRFTGPHNLLIAGCGGFGMLTARF